MTLGRHGYQAAYCALCLPRDFFFESPPPGSGVCADAFAGVFIEQQFAL